MRLIPWTHTNTFRVPMARLFDDFLCADLSAPAWTPAVDVKETENEVIVNVEIPGIDPKDVEVSVVGDVLTLSGEKSEETDEKSNYWHRAERRYGSFTRTIQLPCAVGDNTVAKAVHGVLTVTLDKRPEDKSRRIEIQSN